MNSGLLYTSEFDELTCGATWLTVQSNGSLEISTADAPCQIGSTFTLPPTEEGLREAENMAKALHEWVRHVRETLQENV